MIEKLAVYKKAVVSALGMILMLALTLAPLVDPASTLGKALAFIIAAGTVLGVAAATNRNTNGVTVRGGQPPRY